jgi:RNA polymerase sigma-70 factor (ECF subfamily)
MNPTPISLLERLRLRPDPASWQRLVDLYAPLLRNWLERYSVPHADADDLVQEVLSVLVRELADFQHDLRRGAFRRWLRTILVNRLHAFWRTRRSASVGAGGPAGDELLGRLEDPSDDLARLWDLEHDRYVLRRLIGLLETEFEPTTWAAFRLVALEGRSNAEAAAALGLSVNAVRIARSRVLTRMRQEAEGIID